MCIRDRIETYNEREEEEDGADEDRVERVKLCRACREIVTVVRRVLMHCRGRVMLTTYFRVKGAPIWTVLAACTTSVRGACSGHRTRRSVQNARRRGIASILLARKLQGLGRGKVLGARRGGRLCRQKMLQVQTKVEDPMSSCQCRASCQLAESRLES